ncbi:uncharacterized protein BJX67DRAFT_32434 [Aspergillus lucknowensis]|uniref:Uncharacterized protein n=1 Tax=Aspergillus lucknowensis TaxID=176173 RepID=A0ABR4LX36_9EURO
MSVITTSTPVYPPSGSPNFAGFYPDGTSFLQFGCDPSYSFRTLSSTPAYGNCCENLAAGPCAYATRCSDGTRIYRDGLTATCSEGRSCVEAILYERQTSAEWSATIPWCLLPEHPTVLYWLPTSTFTTTVDEDISTTQSTSLPEPMSTPDEYSPTGLPTDVSTTDGPTQTATSNPDNDDDDDDSGTNVGAIAGGVVGGVAGLTLIILAAWYIMRRQKKKSAEIRELGAGYVAPEGPK